MTPTLFGRWQTRLLLLATVGILITIPFSEPIYFSVLAYIAILGLFWDVVYDFLQKFRWDRDWPGVYQLLAAIWEAIFLLLIANTIDLPLLEVSDLETGNFALHYSLVWLGRYIVSQTLMRIFFPRWRFRGGRFL
ncbi:MAG: hypothetical protein MGU50_11655 [Trichodesmium sp. MAG_R02]|jgi:energy-coupling factor transporter transmembrane protein EcfT|nr:hypothetical protein [Trichodesmium sp. MAG_R02]